MMDVLPIVIIVLAVLLVLAVLVTLKVWKKQKESLWESIRKKPFGWELKQILVQLIVGLTLALIGALLMFDGDILGEKTIGIAWFVGAYGLILMLGIFIRLGPFP